LAIERAREEAEEAAAGAAAEEAATVAAEAAAEAARALAALEIQASAGRRAISPRGVVRKTAFPYRARTHTHTTGAWTPSARPRHRALSRHSTATRLSPQVWLELDRLLATIARLRGKGQQVLVAAAAPFSTH